jgi:dTMP kinase
MKGRKGLLVTFEGGEGAGKTTLIANLAEELRSSGHEVLTTREPGGTRLGEQVRGILLSEGDVAPVREAELLLFLASRAQLVRTVISPALNAGTVVLCDRFSEATIAYQVFGRGLPEEKVRGIDAFAADSVRADLVILVDVPPEVGLSRATGRSGEEGLRRLEGEALEFHRSVRRGYLALSEREPERFLVLDGTRTRESLAEEVSEAVTSLLAARGE